VGIGSTCSEEAPVSHHEKGMAKDMGKKATPKKATPKKK
jgi:hypothetical protein